MKQIRWVLGFVLIAFCGGVATLCGLGIAAGAWLMDREDVLEAKEDVWPGHE
jgi:hypothetical protein